jgi:hypothetical protein
VTQPIPTQSRHPGRATFRTLVAGAVGLLSLLPWIIAGAHLEGTVLGGQALAVSGAVTRILAVPAVNAWITQYLPWLAPAPRQS